MLLCFRGNFICELCNVHAASQMILDVHLSGAKHKAKAALVHQVSKKDKQASKIVPEGGLMVEGRTRLRPGNSVCCFLTSDQKYTFYRTSVPTTKFDGSMSETPSGLLVGL